MLRDVSIWYVFSILLPTSGSDTLRWDRHRCLRVLRQRHCRPRSGNEYRDHHRIRDPVFHYPVILVNLKTKFNENYIYVPYNTLSGRGILKCIKKSNITINGIDIKKNYLIGLTDNIKIKDIDCILNERILEG